jgi:hypothetical protein
MLVYLQVNATLITVKNSTNSTQVTSLTVCQENFPVPHRDLWFNLM